MRKYTRLIIGLATLLLIGGLSILAAMGLMDSVLKYRSPLHDNPPQPGRPLGNPLTRQVVILLIDALRLDTSLEETVMPYLNELRAQGASAAIHSRPPSFSEPGYATILTGAWPDINDGPAINLDYADIPTFTQDDIFSAAHRAGLKTAISGYYWFEKLLPPASVDHSYYTSGEDAATDVEVMQAAIPLLKGDSQLLLIHVDQVDYAGHHLGGPVSPNWDIASRQADDYLREIVSYLDLTQDTLIVLSDHGQIDQGGHGGPEPVTLLEPFVMAGAAVKPGQYPDIQMVDVAPTVAALLGTNIPASAEGRPLTAMLNISAASLSTIRSTELEQKKSLYLAYTAAIDAPPLGFPISDDPGEYIKLLDSASTSRLMRERLWRIPVAILLGILPAGILVWRKKKNAIWFAIGALLYSLLFHFRYGILDGKTYSLSWIPSETGFFLYLGSTVAIALVLAWLLIMGRLETFKKQPRQAARLSMDLIFMILYILALPVLVSFAVNGFGVGWTLPEFYTIFVALLSFIQAIFVSIFGLLLVGLTALIARLVYRP
jgi:hypothetical protein